MVDPSVWGHDKPEHPWKDPEDFWASAREGYQIDPESLEWSIEAAKLEDSKVAGPGDDLLELLVQVGTRRPPREQLPAPRQKAAVEGVTALEEPQTVESLAEEEGNPVLRSILEQKVPK